MIGRSGRVFGTHVEIAGEAGVSTLEACCRLAGGKRRRRAATGYRSTQMLYPGRGTGGSTGAVNSSDERFLCDACAVRDPSGVGAVRRSLTGGGASFGACHRLIYRTPPALFALALPAICRRQKTLSTSEL